MPQIYNICMEIEVSMTHYFSYPT